MTPKDITVGLEMAKKLKQAGWRRQCLYLCMAGDHRTNHKIAYDPNKGPFYQSVYEEKLVREASNLFYAPTFQEIWDELPEHIDSFWLQIEHFDDNLIEIAYVDKKDVYLQMPSDYIANKDTLADTAAKLWIDCKKTGYI